MSHAPGNPADVNPYAATDVPSPRPSLVRYGVLGFAVTMSLLLYLDRFALSVALTTIMKELDLDSQQMGRVTGVFFYVYALAQVPAGWLSDRLGGRVTLTLYVLAWSLALGGMGFATGLISLAVFRILLGLGQAGAYPCIASVNKRWFPVTQRGFANSFTTMGGRTGNLLTTIFTPLLMAAVGATIGWTTGQWRVVFWCYSLLGVGWAVLFWTWFRDTPEQHRSVNAGELNLLQHNSPPPAAAGTGVPLPPFRDMAVCPTMYFLCVIGVFVNIGWIFLVTFLPMFLEKVHKLDLKVVGILVAVPGIAAMCGGVAGGMSTDFLVRKIGLKWGRRATGIIATCGGALAYLGCLITDNTVVLVVLFSIAAFMIDFGLGSLWAVYQDIAGKHVAAVLGFANMCGNLAAGFFSEVIGRYAKAGAWPTVFAISALALFATAAGWCLVDPTRPLVRDE